MNGRPGVIVQVSSAKQFVGQDVLDFRRHSRRLYIQQQSSSSSSNGFIKHDVSTRKLEPSSGIRPSFLTDPFILLCCYV